MLAKHRERWMERLRDVFRQLYLGRLRARSGHPHERASGPLVASDVPCVCAPSKQERRDGAAMLASESAFPDVRRRRSMSWLRRQNANDGQGPAIFRYSLGTYIEERPIAEPADPHASYVKTGDWVENN